MFSIHDFRCKQNADSKIKGILYHTLMIEYRPWLPDYKNEIGFIDPYINVKIKISRGIAYEYLANRYNEN